MDVNRSNVKNIYPLSPMQEGMLFHALADQGSHAYFQQISWRIQGDLDLAEFVASWNALVERHEVLRSAFVHEGVNRPLQVVLKERAVEFAVEDLSSLGAAEQRQAVESARQKERARGFDLAREVLLRVRVFSLDARSHEILWSHHHIVLDGWSLGILLAELLELYRARRARTRPTLPAATPFVEYIKWLEARDQAASTEFWSRYLAGHEGVARLPERTKLVDDAARPAARDLAEHAFSLDEDATTQLVALASRRTVTLSTLLQVAWGVLLCRYNDTVDVVFGAVVSGRPPEIAGIERMVGNFINTIPVRLRIEPGARLVDVLQQMQEDALACAPHHSHPLARISAGSARAAELLATVVVCENYPLDQRLRGPGATTELGFTTEAVESFDRTHFDFLLEFAPGPCLGVRMVHDRRVHDDRTIRRIEGHLRALLRALVDEPDARVDAVKILSAEERSFLLGAIPAAPERPSATVVDLFRERAAMHPERPAVSAGHRTLSYAELDALSTRVAAHLVERCGVERGDHVALLMERGVWTIVGALGAMKAGAAYVPFVTSDPHERTERILAHATCKVGLVAHDGASGHALPCVDIRALPAADGADLPLPRANDLAYVIYTSGSTGAPRGVMIEHRSVVNLVSALGDVVYRNDAGPLRVALIASVVFDASVQQIFGALLQGHHLIVVDDDTKRDGAALNRLLLSAGVDVADCTPSLLSLMAQAEGIEAVCARVRHLIVGGEALSGALVQRLGEHPGELTLTNVYGPTECCVDVTAHRVDHLAAPQPEIVPLGRPLPGISAFVVERGGRLSGIGVKGEILLAGVGVGRGYLGVPELTHARFIEHPFVPGERAYRTGDLGRWSEDGVLEFFGRTDDQVKIRGHRIELGDIEARLRAHPAVKDAAAMVAPGAHGHDELWAFLTAHEELDVTSLRAHLGQMLPHYMIPARFLCVDALPLNASGKVDRRALPRLSESRELAQGAHFVAPATPLEEELAEVFRTVLHHERVGVEDNYFALGGDSIKAIQLVSRLARAGRKVSLREIFRHPTIRDLAPYVVHAASDHAISPPQGPAPLGPIQRRFFAEHRVEPARFNHEVMLSSREPIDARAARSAMEALVWHHDALRLAFREVDGDRVQEVVPFDASALGFEILDLTLAADPTPDLARFVDALHGGFDLAKGALLEAAVVRMPDGDRLLLVAHHLAVDSVSWRILLEDLAHAYERARRGEPAALPEATTPFTRWASALEGYARGEAVQRELPYWREVVTAQGPPLPTDHLAAGNARRDEEGLSRSFTAQLSQDLTGPANRAYGTTAEDLLLTALARALWRWTGRTRSLLQKESHGREDLLEGIDISRTVGWFTSIHPMLLELPADRDLGYQIKSIKDAVRRIPNRGVGYGVLRYLREGGGELAPPRIADVSFNYLGAFEPDSFGFSIARDAAGRPVSPDADRGVELDLSGLVAEGILEITLLYNRHRFEASTMAGLLDLLRDEVIRVAEHCMSKQLVELTPSDLTYSELSLDELETLF